MSKKDNPIKVVHIRQEDHRPPPQIKVDHKIFDEGATPNHRNYLASEVRKVAQYFSKSFKQWDTLPAVAKITLKQQALAKSHRPQALFTIRSCPIIGTLDYGELLVSATKEGLDELENRILNNTAKQQIANISAVEKIEPYTAKDSLQYLDKTYQPGKHKVKVRLFDHKDHQKNSILEQAFSKYIENKNIKVQRLNYGSQQILTIEAQNNLGEQLVDFVGIRSAKVMPQFLPSDISTQVTPISPANEEHCPPPLVDETYPIVGVIDSGISPDCTLLEPWIHAKESYVPNGLENYSHGTMVAGLIVNSFSLNHHDNIFPQTQAKIVDVNVFPHDGSVDENDLVAIISEVVPKYPEVKVWNLSLGASQPVDQYEFSDFARFLDEMHDTYGCLFVIASGNQQDQKTWPTNLGNHPQNRISAPGDSIRSLTIGSIAHKETPSTLVKIEDVSPFSRIGPGPCYIPKPELTHYGGNNTINGSFAQTGVLSLGANNMICESIGTSFATPIVSSQAAALIHYLSTQNPEQDIPPERIKALLIHSALLNNPHIDSSSIHGHGFGKPGDLIDTLYCDPHCITLMFETELKHKGFEFQRFPFPIPDCLITEDGKFRGEIAMTLVYSPLTDQDFASEYCRTNVDAGMGSFDEDNEGKRRFSSQVPAAPKDINQLYEKSRIEHGFKWSPVKAYHRKFPVGVNINTWRLKLKVERRAEETRVEEPQKASLILSLRALDTSLPVYNESIQKMNQLGWSTQDIDIGVRIRQ